MAVLDQMQTLLQAITITSDVAGRLSPGMPAKFDLHLPGSDLSVSTLLTALHGQPITSELTEVVVTTQAVTNIVGILTNRVTGTLISQLLDRIPVKLSIEWSLKDDRGVALLPGVDFLTSDAAMKSLSLSLLFKPPFAEMTLTPAPPRRVLVTATVTLGEDFLNDLRPDPRPTEMASAFRYGPVQSPHVSIDINLPAIELLPIELPSIVALFQAHRFQPYADDGEARFVVVVFSGDTPLSGSVAELNGLLHRADELLAPLRSLVSFASVLTDLSILQRALKAQPMTRLIRAPVRKFNDIHVNVETFLGIDVLDQDRRADNRVSSLIFLGAPGRQVKCFRRHKFEEGDGAFVLRMPDDRFVVKIESLALSNTEMRSLGFVEVTTESSDNFDDNMSSITFDV